MRKYGRENFSFTIIEECEQEKLVEREIYWIEYYDTYNSGYNATRGGDLPDENKVHRGEDHSCAKLTEADVVQCRLWYKEGKRSKEIWEEYFQDAVKYSTFQNMWLGRTWKHIMPEVFEANPHPRVKYTKEEVLEIKRMMAKGKTNTQIFHAFNDRISKTTISDIRTGKRYGNILLGDITTISESGE